MLILIFVKQIIKLMYNEFQYRPSMPAKLFPKNLFTKLLGESIIRRVNNHFMNEETNISNNIEIDQALKEFEAKNIEQTLQAPEALKTSTIPQKEVEGVKFEIPSYGAVKYYNETDTPKIVKLVMKWSGGTIKEQKQAEYILLAFVVVAIGISGFLAFSGGGTHSKPSTADLEHLKQTPINK